MTPLLLFAALPYAALLVFLIGTIQRYRTKPFTYSSLSSQFLENKQQFWGVVGFHYGIFGLIAGHLIGFCFPQSVLAWNSRPLRLYILEVTGLAFGSMTLIGLLVVMHRRGSISKPRRVTSRADWLIEALLAIQVILGISTAILHPWGSSWFAASISPYLWSLVKFNPNVAFLTTLPLIAKLHLVNASLILGLFPFTRLVHLLVAPFPYLWRKPEVARWYGIRTIPDVFERMTARTR